MVGSGEREIESGWTRFRSYIQAEDDIINASQSGNEEKKIFLNLDRETPPLREMEGEEPFHLRAGRWFPNPDLEKFKI